MYVVVTLAIVFIPVQAGPSYRSLMGYFVGGQISLVVPVRPPCPIGRQGRGTSRDMHLGHLHGIAFLLLFLVAITLF